MFAPHPSPFDFYFRIGPVPVRVSWTHWLGAALLGWNSLFYLGRDQGPQPIFLLLWLTVVFISILVHELGHAFMARAFGCRSDVTLVFFGGFARYDRPPKDSSGREVLITLAGPGAGFLLFFLTQLLFLALPGILPNVGKPIAAEAIVFTVTRLAWVNLVWSILNLMPVLPLDGGRVMDVICRAFSPASGAVASRWIGVVFGGLIGFYFFSVVREPIPGMMFLLFAFWNYQDVTQNTR